MTHLPPPAAWKHPEKWLLFEHGVAVGINPDAPKLDLPTDRRGLVLPREAMLAVRSLFKDRYRWRYIPSDPSTKPDIHHWYNPAAMYEPERNGGDILPSCFREDPHNLAYIQRKFHNTVHAVSNPLTMPNREYMREFLDKSHAEFAERKMLRHLAMTALQTILARKQFGDRRRMVEQFPELLNGRRYDDIGEEYMQHEFARNHTAYRNALMRALEYQDAVSNPKIIIEKRRASPDHVLKMFGRASLDLSRRQYSNFVSDLLQAA